jgi:hypothetical protein
MGLTQRELCSAGVEGAGMEFAANPLPWFAVTSKPQHERKVYEGLVQKGLESFLPLYWTSRDWSDRRKRSQ